MKGIYSISIGGKIYVGKDAQIDKKKRLKEHLNLLKKNEHYNTYLQNAYNKHKEYKYCVLYKSDEITLEELSELKKEYINKLDSYNNGYNLTLGGEGGLGIVVDEQGRESRSKRTIGELNPQSKLSNEQFYEIVELFMQGKTNSEIAKMYNLHDRYVSLIRHKKRFKKLWETVEDYKEETSNGQRRGLDYNGFLKAVEMLKNGCTNAEIERTLGLSSGTGSRIRHKKLYKRFWNQYQEENK
ncbi:nuclease [Lysinibacillus sp. BW-2-10]|nr:nuclease [Lysinibacillus sp. BW-2-10]